MGKASLWDIFAFDFNLKLHKNQNRSWTAEFSFFPEWLSEFWFQFSCKSQQQYCSCSGVQGFALLFVSLDTLKPLFIRVSFPLTVHMGIEYYVLLCILLWIEGQRPTIISIQIRLLKNLFQERKQKVKLNATNINFIMVSGCSVNIKLIKII